MIKATIQNSSYCTEMTFPYTETELLKMLRELGIEKEHLVPMGTEIDIKPVELSILTDCEVNLDALNYVRKRVDGMSKAERNQFLAVLSCDELGTGCGLKNIINLTYNLARYTLIEDTDDFEHIGRMYMLNIHGALTEAEFNNREWLADEGMKLIDSSRGIDTEYGKIYVNENVPFEEIFNRTMFPVYYCDPNATVSVEVSYLGQTELVDLPNEDIVIKKALARLGADSIENCTLKADSFQDISDEQWEKIKTVENTKDLFGLNNLLKTEDIRIKQERPVDIFNNEVTKVLRENGYELSQSDGLITVFSDEKITSRVNQNGVVSAVDDNNAAYFEIQKIVRNVNEYCTVYEKDAPLKAEDLSGNYRYLSEFKQY